MSETTADAHPAPGPQTIADGLAETVERIMAVLKADTPQTQEDTWTSPSTS